ncbi:MAG TPA: AMP-binding protein, partial [Tepidisphaeraceae bacterium]
MNVTHLLLRQAAERPNTLAILERAPRRGGRSETFASLQVASAHAAARFQADGVRAGDAVLVFVPMSADLYVILIALFRLGAVAMFLDPSAGREHIARCCEILPPKAMIAVPKAHLLRLTTPALRRIPLHYSVNWWLPLTKWWSRSKSFPADMSVVTRVDDDAALITFTSGSTGRPKAAARSHGFLR